jgi:hypothetical protein
VRAQAATLEYQAWLKRMVDDQSPVKGPRRVRIGRDRAPATFPSSTLPAQPSITTGGVIVCTSSTRPSGVDGQLIFETDTDRLLEYDATLAAWVPPRGVGYVGPSSSPPAIAYDGELWFRTDTRDLVVRNAAGSSWVAVAANGVPIYTSGTRPFVPADGTIIFETDTRRLMVYSFGLGWQSPAGLVYIGTSSTRPNLQYDGQTIFETDTRRLMTFHAAAGSWVPTPGTVLICTSSTRPVAAIGRGIYETDTHRLLVYTTATTQWQQPWNMPWGHVGSGFNTVTQPTITTEVGITGMSVTWTAVANRRYLVTAWVLYTHTGTDADSNFYIRNGVGGALLAQSLQWDANTTHYRTQQCATILSIPAGSYTVACTINTVAGSISTLLGTPYSLLLVQDIGPSANPA